MDVEELSEVFAEGSTQRHELELLVSFDRSSQGKRPFLLEHHDPKEKNTQKVTSRTRAGKLSTGSRDSSRITKLGY